LNDGRRASFEPALAPSPPDVPELPDSSSELASTMRGAELVGQHVSDRAMVGADATAARVAESLFERVEMSGSTWRGAAIRDSIFEDGSWANVDAAEVRLTRVEMRRVRLTGASFTGATVSDVTFEECRLDLSLFRFANLERVRFEDCRMEETDFYETSLTSVVFNRTDLTNASLARASLSRCEMRESELSAIGNPERLRGVAMPWADVVRAAGTLAVGLEIHILDG
jgi:uncharacterized protein YjbI with pentapeptide repeats